MTSPANRREWEDRLVLTAAYFTCSKPQIGVRARGERMRWLITEYDSLRLACDAADRFGPRALVYAVGPQGESAPLARADWERYLKMREK